MHFTGRGSGEQPKSGINTNYTDSFSSGSTSRIPSEDEKQKLESLPQALVVAAKKGDLSPIQRIFKNEHTALLKYERDNYLQALREGFVAAAQGGHTPIVKTMLPIMSKIHHNPFLNTEKLYYDFPLAKAIPYVAQFGDWDPLKLILSELKKIDRTGDPERRYITALCDGLEHAASNGQYGVVQSLLRLPDFQRLSTGTPEQKDKYARTIVDSASAAIKGEYLGVFTLLEARYRGLIQGVILAKPDNFDRYLRTFFRTMVYAAQTGNTKFIKDFLPLYQQGKKHVEYSSEYLREAYWEARSNRHVETARKLEDPLIEYYGGIPGPPTPPFED